MIQQNKCKTYNISPWRYDKEAKLDIKRAIKQILTGGGLVHIYANDSILYMKTSYPYWDKNEIEQAIYALRGFETDVKPSNMEDVTSLFLNNEVFSVYDKQDICDKIFCLAQTMNVLSGSVIDFRDMKGVIEKTGIEKRWYWEV
jgi:hypothetical protein